VAFIEQIAFPRLAGKYSNGVAPCRRSISSPLRVELKLPAKPILSLTGLKALEEKLPLKRFMRVHRSFIVSLDAVGSMTKTAIEVGKKQIAIG
jgi:hypothetical protein